MNYVGPIFSQPHSKLFNSAGQSSRAGAIETDNRDAKLADWLKPVICPRIHGKDRAADAHRIEMFQVRVEQPLSSAWSERLNQMHDVQCCHSRLGSRLRCNFACRNSHRSIFTSEVVARACDGMQMRKSFEKVIEVT